MFTRFHRRTVSFIAFTGMLWLATPGFANAIDRYREKLQTLRAELDTQSDQDAAGLAQSDIAQISTWLGEAEALLKDGDGEAASYKLKRAEYGLDLVRALAVASQIEAKAAEQEAAFGQSDAQVASLKAEVEALQAKKSELTQQINQVR